MKYDVTDFKSEVLERSTQLPVVVDFWAEWCGPCKVLGPVLEKLAQESDGRWALAKIDTEKHQEVAAEYNIRSIPSVKLFVDGKVAGEFIGALPEPMVRQWLGKNIPGKFQKDIQNAVQLLVQDKTVEARELLETVVQNEPGNLQARTLLAKAYIYEDPGKAVELVKDIEQDSEHFELAEAIRTVASLFDKGSHPESLPDSPARQTCIDAIANLRALKFDDALEKFIQVIRTDRYYDDDSSRKACIAIFKILEEEHETTKKYRREFSRALY